MFDTLTLILAVYVVSSILRRSQIRKRDMDRLKAKVAELGEIVALLQKSGESTEEVSEKMLGMQLRDIRAQLDGFDLATESAAQSAFEQLHYVEETISRSVVMTPALSAEGESTL